MDADEKTIDDLDGFVEYPLVNGPLTGSHLTLSKFFSRPGLPREITLNWANSSATYALRALHGPEGQLRDLVYRFKRYLRRQP
jgi:hypothetical protein